MTASVVLFSVPQVASWQVTDLEEPGPRAALPALQRGFVWKPGQVELLWDSLLRGFPVGSFLLTPYDGAQRGQSRMALHSSEPPRDADFHLLDGQQRATSMALGFHDPWLTPTAGGYEAVLWVDLTSLPAEDDRLYAFRLLTRSHPWGYRRDRPGQTLSSHAIREALEAFAQAHPQLKNKRPWELPLTHVWPHDAGLPVPLPLLLDSVRHTDWEAHLRQRLSRIPAAPWTEAVAAALAVPSSEAGQALQALCRAVTDVRSACRIPAQVLALPQGDGEGPDPIETLFVRVNQGGTRLDSEELLYSLLKAAWIDAPQFMDRIRHRMASPARLVLLAARLSLADKADARAEAGAEMPQTPSVARFRQLIRGKDATDALQHWLKGQETIFEQAKVLLEDGSFGLPPVLSAHLFRSPDLALVLLRWLQRLQRAGLEPETLPPDARRGVIGLCTALQWFAPDPAAAARILWRQLHQCPDAGLTAFWGRTAMLACCALQGNPPAMIPLPSPEVLEDAFAARIFTPSFYDSKGSIWEDWSWEKWSGSPTDGVRRFLQQNLDQQWLRWLESNRPDASTAAQELAVYEAQAWRHFVDRLCWLRPLLLYAQRDMIRQWFPGYDASIPQRMEDMDCPWDYDHIHPSNCVSGRWYIPRLIRDWHGSIANFRVWPLEANRSDHDTAPRIKLEDVLPVEAAYAGMFSGAAERRASAVNEAVDWPFWRESTPPGTFSPAYLGDPASADYRKALMHALVLRLCCLYKEWYGCLRLADLFPHQGDCL